MPEIGATLREARLRAKVDISEVEIETKIRARYLRALENEEWSLLPGPTFIKSFLRTYAEYLGLDARLLVDEYKNRHERLSDLDVQPIARRRMGDERPSRRRRPPGWVIALALAALVPRPPTRGSNGDTQGAGTPAPPRAQPTAGEQRKAARERRALQARRKRAAAQRKQVTLQLVPTGPVSVCLQDGKGRTLVANQILRPGQQRSFKAKEFRLTLGTNALTLRANGRTIPVSPSANGIGLRIRAPRTVTPLPAGQRPNCLP